MNALRIALVLVAVLILIALAVPVIGEPQQEIVVEGADEILPLPVSETPPPVELEARVVAAYSNDILRMDLEAMAVPPPVPQRVVVEYANEILRAALAMAVEFPVPERIVFAYANANLHPELVYPVELMCDTTPPAISDVTPEISSSSTVTITWTTDEFADSWVLYGEEPDQYGPPEGNDTLVKVHKIGLTGLISETTYYYRVRSTDRCGNTATSTEYSFEACAERYIYLPLVLRDSP